MIIRYVLFLMFFVLIFNPSYAGCEDGYTDNSVQFMELAKKIARMSYPDKEINFSADNLKQSYTGWLSYKGSRYDLPNLYFVEMTGGYQVCFEFKETVDEKSKFRKYDISKIHHQKGHLKYDFRVGKWCKSDGEYEDADLLKRTYDKPLAVDLERLVNVSLVTEKSPASKIGLDQLKNHVGQSVQIAMKNGDTYENVIITEVKADRISIQRHVYGGTVEFEILKNEIAQVTF